MSKSNKYASSTVDSSSKFSKEKWPDLKNILTNYNAFSCRYREIYKKTKLKEWYKDCIRIYNLEDRATVKNLPKSDYTIRLGSSCSNDPVDSINTHNNLLITYTGTIYKNELIQNSTDRLDAY